MDADYPAGEDGTAVEAVVAGPCVAQVVMLRLGDGAQRQLSVPEPLCRFFRPGVRVVVYRGPGGDLLGWLLPDEQVGMDLRDYGGEPEPRRRAADSELGDSPDSP